MWDEAVEKEAHMISRAEAAQGPWDFCKKATGDVYKTGTGDLKQLREGEKKKGGTHTRTHTFTHTDRRSAAMVVLRFGGTLRYAERWFRFRM